MGTLERSHHDFRKRLLAEALSEQFGLALLEGNAANAEQVAREALELELEEAVLYDLVVAPAMHRIGKLWAAGEIGVGHEHLATQIATRVLVLAHDVAGAAADRPGHRAMLAAAEGEQHVVGLEMAGKLLESAGYEVLSLGADVPTDALPDVIADLEPALVALSATMPEAGARLPAAVAAVRDASDDIGLIVGGTSARSNLGPGPQLIIEPDVARVVEIADGLVRRAGLN